MNNNQYDMIIVGGGMVGATLACALGDSELRIAVIEGYQPEAFDASQRHDLRVSALSIASQNILQSIGVWDAIASMRVCPYRRMRVWESQGDTEFVSDDIQCSELGYIVENRLTQLALLNRLKDFSNIDLLCPVRPKQITYSADRSTIELEDGQVLMTSLLIAADGGESKVRQAAGIGVHHLDYDQHAMVMSVETAYPQQDITWQRFVPTGPQAFLPLSGQCASIVWYHTPDDVRRLKNLSDSQLLQEMSATFPDCLGEIKQIYSKGSFPLRSQHAQQYVKAGIALIGDAAHMIHPLAGQGVNIGLLDAAALAETIITARRSGHFIGAESVLKSYEQRRRKDNWVMMTTMDLFYRVFSNDHIALKLLRNLGLGLAQRLRPAKNKVTRYAMGLEGNLPKLARGESINT